MRQTWTWADLNGFRGFDMVCCFPLSDSPHPYEPMIWIDCAPGTPPKFNMEPHNFQQENLFQTACLEFHIQFRSRVETTIHENSRRIQRLWKKRIAVAAKRCWQQPRTPRWTFYGKQATANQQAAEFWVVISGPKKWGIPNWIQLMIVIMEEMMIKPWQICTYIYIYIINYNEY